VSWVGQRYNLLTCRHPPGAARRHGRGAPALSFSSETQALSTLGKNTWSHRGGHHSIPEKLESRSFYVYFPRLYCVLQLHLTALATPIVPFRLPKHPKVSLKKNPQHVENQFLPSFSQVLLRKCTLQS